MLTVAIIVLPVALIAYLGYSEYQLTKRVKLHQEASQKRAKEMLEWNDELKRGER